VTSSVLEVVSVAPGWSQVAWRKSFELLHTSPADISDRDVELLARWPGATKRESDEARADVIKRRDTARNKAADDHEREQKRAKPVRTTRRALPAVDGTETFEELTKSFEAHLAAHRSEAATCEELDVVLTLVTSFREVVEKFTEQLNAKNIERNERIAALEQKVAQLEARPLPKWCGVFEDGKAYSEASLITDRGSLWLATRDTAQRPGDAGSGWRLVVKKGDAR
jgi:hypothetical protein